MFTDLFCCRYVSQQRYNEAVDLLKDGAVSLLRANQISSGADLGLLLINTLDKAGAPTSEKYIGKTASLLALTDISSLENNSCRLIAIISMHMHEMFEDLFL